MYTLQSIYDFDNSIFDGLETPDGLDRDLLISNIMLKCGLLQPIYGEPLVFKAMVTVWSRSNQWNMQRLVRTAAEEYNPLHNFDRHEEIDINRTGIDSIDRGSTRNVTMELNQDISDDDDSKITTTDRPGEKVETTTEVSAYDSNAYQPDSKNTVERSGTNTVTAQSEGGNKRSRNDFNENTDTVEDKELKNSTDTEKHDNHMYGNIGVTTSQQMFEAEVALVKSFNVYEVIASMFENDNMITVY